MGMLLVFIYCHFISDLNFRFGFIYILSVGVFVYSYFFSCWTMCELATLYRTTGHELLFAVGNHDSAVLFLTLQMWMYSSPTFLFF